MKMRLLNRIAKIIKPLAKLKGFLGKILPKRKQNKQIEELRAEIENLKQQINKTEKKAIDVLTENKTFFQAEMYVNTVISGQDESGGAYFWLINTNEETTIKEFFDLPVTQIKRKLGIPKNYVVTKINKGMTTADENKFFEKTKREKNYYKSDEELRRNF